MVPTLQSGYAAFAPPIWVTGVIVSQSPSLTPVRKFEVSHAVSPLLRVVSPRLPASEAAKHRRLQGGDIWMMQQHSFGRACGVGAATAAAGRCL